jgi:hypothetical protein
MGGANAPRGARAWGWRSRSQASKVSATAPAAVDGERMAAVGELPVVSHGRRLAMALERRLADRGRHRVILASAGDEERAARRIPGRDLGRRAGRQVGESGLEERLPERWDRSPVVELIRLLFRDRVPEPVAELLARQRNRPVSVRRVPERDGGDPKRGRRQEDDALDRRGVDRDACCSAARSWPRSRCTIRPPKEWPMTIGLASSPLMAWA